MSLESALEVYPKEIKLRDDTPCVLRPLQSEDEEALFQFFQAVPENERMFIKHRVADREVIHDWCANIDLGRNLPLLAFSENKILAACTLHQQLGGWKRHIGRISVLVHAEYRQRGLARALVAEILTFARQCGLEKVEAEFIEDQERAMKVFGMLGFNQLVRLNDYVKDMQAGTHDYILMGLQLITDEEFAGMG